MHIVRQLDQQHPLRLPHPSTPGLHTHCLAGGSGLRCAMFRNMQFCKRCISPTRSSLMTAMRTSLRPLGTTDDLKPEVTGKPPSHNQPRGSPDLLIGGIPIQIADEGGGGSNAATWAGETKPNEHSMLPRVNTAVLAINVVPPAINVVRSKTTERNGARDQSHASRNARTPSDAITMCCAHSLPAQAGALGLNGRGFRTALPRFMQKKYSTCGFQNNFDKKSCQNRGSKKFLFREGHPRSSQGGGGGPLTGGNALWWNAPPPKSAS